MTINAGLKNCRIIVKESTQAHSIADTVITSCDWQTNMVRIDALSLDQSVGSTDVLVLIFEQNHLYEYRGKLGNITIANEREIWLYQGKQREGRLCSRYSFCADGYIEKIKILDQQVLLRKPIEAATLNISSNGILMQTFSESFQLQDEIVINVRVDTRRMRLACKVVRMQNNNLWTEEYGCKILSILS